MLWLKSLSVTSSDLCGFKMGSEGASEFNADQILRACLGLKGWSWEIPTLHFHGQDNSESWVVRPVKGKQFSSIHKEELLNINSLLFISEVYGMRMMIKHTKNAKINKLLYILEVEKAITENGIGTTELLGRDGVRLLPDLLSHPQNK